ITGLASIGGFGGASGDGGAVTVTNHAGANIITTGYAATAIVAQSVGGGGGEGAISGNNGQPLPTPPGPGNTDAVNGRAISHPVAATNDGEVAGNGGSASGLLALGGFGGASGSGGIVKVNNSALLQTSGDHAIGILAQSVGGGGGDGGGTGLSVVAVGGFSSGLGATGDGGAVTGADFAVAPHATTANNLPSGICAYVYA